MATKSAAPSYPSSSTVQNRNFHDALSKAMKVSHDELKAILADEKKRKAKTKRNVKLPASPDSLDVG